MNDLDERPDWPDEPGRTFVSPSQLKQRALCKRRWAYVKIDGLIGEPTPEMEFGKLVHARIEAHVETGAPFGDDDVGRVAAQAATHLRSTPAIVEGIARIDLDGEGVPGVSVCGYVDLLDASNGRPRVVDWKVGKLPDSKYRKEDARRHADDPQVTAYGEWAGRAAGVEKVDATFVHLGCEEQEDGTRKPIGTATKTSEHVVGGPRWKALVEKARETSDDKARLKSASEADPSPSGCRAFGRWCEHVERCEVGTLMVGLTEEFARRKRGAADRRRQRQQPGAA